MSVNKEAGTTKLVTQWNISAISYDDDSNDFEESHMEEWLNDKTVDGFLGNLREPEKFIVMDAVWDATLTTSSSKPAETTIVEDAVGLLNYYEYVTSYDGTTYQNGYLNNELCWWTLTPYNSSNVHYVNNNDNANNNTPTNTNGVRHFLVLITLKTR